MTVPPKNAPVSRQDGAVLVLGLILLLLLTLISVTAMRMALVEERMTGNTIDAEVAFQAAEAALRDGEQLLQQPGLPDFDGTNGLYQAAASNDPPRWLTLDWSSNTASRAYAGMATAPYPLSKATARFIIEEMPVEVGAGESLSADTAMDEIGMFRITARGVGISGTAIVTLQSTFKR